ncbi:MAG: hypothetical protein JSW70_04985 [Syntrophobacterales bacterium]|nr:MAG: hypothetical protein JSW70_04985 [Syntrophobacterales bacterium]
MPRFFLLFIILSLLVLRCATAEMPEKGKEATSVHSQKDISHKPDGCKKEGKGKQPQVVPGEVLVKFKASVTRKGIDGIQKAYGLSLIKAIESIGVYRFKIPPGSTVKDMVDALNGDPQVEYAEPNYTVSIIGK